jgi:hypothetical protein
MLRQFGPEAAQALPMLRSLAGSTQDAALKSSVDGAIQSFVKRCWATSGRSRSAFRALRKDRLVVDHHFAGNASQTKKGRNDRSFRPSVLREKHRLNKHPR